MSLKSCVQHLASKAGILPLGKIFPTSSLSYKERQKPQKPDLPRGSGPRSPSTRPPWSQTLPGVPLPGAHPAPDRATTSASGRSGDRQAARGWSLAAVALRWLQTGSGWASPAPSPRRASSLPLLKSHLESRALHHVGDSAPSPAGGSAPCYLAPD